MVMVNEEFREFSHERLGVSDQLHTSHRSRGFSGYI